jgi:hypothetical protein
VFIVPSVLELPAPPPAFQFQETKVLPLLFDLVSAPTVKPSVPKAVKPSDCVSSASVVFE